MKDITFSLFILIMVIGGYLIVSYHSPSNKEYQMSVDADSIRLYDGNRYVGSLASSAVPALDSLIIEDNR